MNTPNYCPLPITDRRRAYVSSHHTDIAETIRRHAPILVSSIVQYGDDYDLTERTAHLDMAGEFRK
jgi:hypothetical protein